MLQEVLGFSFFLRLGNPGCLPTLNQLQPPASSHKRHRPRLRRTSALEQVQRPHMPGSVSLILKADTVGVLRQPRGRILLILKPKTLPHSSHSRHLLPLLGG